MYCAHETLVKIHTKTTAFCCLATRECESTVIGHVVPMLIKWVAMVTGDKNSNHGTLLFIAFINTFMLCKYHLHTADNSSRLSIFAKKVVFQLRKKSMISGVGEKNIL